MLSHFISLITFLDSDDDNNEAVEVLDELYGHSWRANENNILTHSEPRNRKKQPQFTHLAKTERYVADLYLYFFFVETVFFAEKLKCTEILT